MNVVVDSVRQIGPEIVLSVALLKGSVVVVLTLLALALLRQRSADVRARVLGAGLLALLFLAMLSPFTQGWWHQFETNRDVLQQPIASVFASRALPLPGITVGGAILLTWASGAVVMLLALGASVSRAQRIARVGEALDDERILAAFRHTCRQLRLRRTPGLSWSQGLASPAVVGHRKATVLLPADASRWSDGTLSAVLLHEVGHVARGDYAWLIVAETVRALFWLNPLVHLLPGRLRRAQDQACDDLALSGGMSPRDYVRGLVAVAQSIVGSGLRLAPSMAHRRSEVARRVALILASDTCRARAGRTTLLTVALLAAVISVGLGAVYPWACS